MGSETASAPRIAADLDVPVVDLALYFQSDGGEELFLDAAHPNAAGHRLIAEALWEALTPQRPVEPLAFSLSKTPSRPKRRS